MSYKILFEKISKSVIPRSTKQLPNTDVDNLIKSEFIDSLILNDKIHLVVNGPNLDIVALYRWFEKKEVEQLIEDKILHFIYAPYIFTYLTKKNVETLKLSSNPGLNLITAIDPSFENIFDATYLALKEQTDYPRSYRRKISRIAEKNSIIIPKEDFTKYIVETSHSDVRGEIGKHYGFNQVENPDDGEINDELLRRYLDITHSNNILFLGAKANCSSILGNENTNEILSVRVNNISIKIDKTIPNFGFVKSFEDMPNLNELLQSSKLTLKDIIKVRNSSDGEKFREWIHNLKSESEIGIIKEYVHSLFGKKSDKTSSKLLRILFNTGLGALLTPLNPIVGIGAGVGLNLLDSFLIDKIINKWEPKFFIEELKKVSKTT